MASIRYRKTIKRYMDNGEIKEKYAAKILSGPEYSLKDVAQLVEMNSTLVSYEFEMAVKALAHQLGRLLSSGAIVDLGELGRFKAGFKTKLCDSLDEVSPKTITEIHINYKPSKELLREVQQTDLELDRRYDEYGRPLEYAHTKQKRVRTL